MTNTRFHGLTIFQSTLSVRRATLRKDDGNEDNTFQSTLSVRRATNEWCTRAVGVDISIHALRKESDLRGCSIL